MFEDNRPCDEYTSQIRLIEETSEPVSNMILNDLMFETIQAANYGEDITLEASPEIYNQDDEADKVNIILSQQ